jgi:hypothetical protein
VKRPSTLYHKVRRAENLRKGGGGTAARGAAFAGVRVVLVLGLLAVLATPGLAQEDDSRWAVTGGISLPRKLMNRLASEGPMLGVHRYGAVRSIPLRYSLEGGCAATTPSKGQYTQISLTANAVLPLRASPVYAIGGVGAMYQVVYIDAAGREKGTDPAATAGFGASFGRWFGEARYTLVFNERPRVHVIPVVVGFRF